MCLWVLRGWKIGQLEIVERKLREEGRRSGGVVEKPTRSDQEGYGQRVERGVEDQGEADEIRAVVGEGVVGEEVKITPAVLERVGTQDDVRKASWEWRDLLRRMCKNRKV